MKNCHLKGYEVKCRNRVGFWEGWLWGNATLCISFSKCLRSQSDEQVLVLDYHEVGGECFWKHKAYCWKAKAYWSLRIVESSCFGWTIVWKDDDLEMLLLKVVISCCHLNSKTWFMIACFLCLNKEMMPHVILHFEAAWLIENDILYALVRL